jgi:hypothetical protein
MSNRLKAAAAASLACVNRFSMLVASLSLSVFCPEVFREELHNEFVSKL